MGAGIRGQTSETPIDVASEGRGTLPPLLSLLFLFFSSLFIFLKFFNFSLSRVAFQSFVLFSIYHRNELCSVVRKIPTPI